MYIFLCESSFDGILSGIFDIYASKLDLRECRLEIKDQYEPVLFAEYREVSLDAWKAERVARKIRTSMSNDTYRHLYRVSLHHSLERAERIFRFVELGLKYGKRALRMLQEPAVFEMFQLDRNVGREAHALIEFARFERLESGIYYCKVGPVNRVLELVAEHFVDRFPNMNWMIYDEVHSTAAIHSEKGVWFIHHGVTEEDIHSLIHGTEKDVYVDLWKVFFHAIAIEERRNERCQRNLLPLHYRKYMTEFHD